MKTKNVKKENLQEPANQSVNPEPTYEEKRQAILGDLNGLFEEVAYFSAKLNLSRQETLDLLRHREVIIMNSQLRFIREALSELAK